MLKLRQTDSERKYFKTKVTLESGHTSKNKVFRLHNLIPEQVQEMLDAKHDNKAMLSIINKLNPYMKYIVNLMYQTYGEKHDNASSYEDLFSWVSLNIIKAIKNC